MKQDQSDGATALDDNVEIGVHKCNCLKTALSAWAIFYFWNKQGRAAGLNLLVVQFRIRRSNSIPVNAGGLPEMTCVPSIAVVLAVCPYWQGRRTLRAGPGRGQLQIRVHESQEDTQICILLDESDPDGDKHLSGLAKPKGLISLIFGKVFPLFGMRQPIWQKRLPQILTYHLESESDMRIAKGQGAEIRSKSFQTFRGGQQCKATSMEFSIADAPLVGVQRL